MYFQTQMSQIDTWPLWNTGWTETGGMTKIVDFMLNFILNYGSHENTSDSDL